jgi:sugar phosphate isomerase/epimerase
LQIDPRYPFHLTYCTNIHPGENWASVEATLRDAGPALKARLSPEMPFGLGLRLSALAAREALEGGFMSGFRHFLDANGLYVALINGYPYGEFHGTAVKDQVFAPDWTTEARLNYTLDLLAVLSGLLPPGIDGGISTMPLSYKPWLQRRAEAPQWEAIVGNLVRLAEAMARLSRAEGKLIHLDIEPEPDGLIENTAEVVRFFRDWLLPVGGPMLARALRVDEDWARQLLLDHIRICFDSCHIAVEYEKPADALAALRAEGIQIGRVQLSSALKVALPGHTERLAPFADSTYLHQVIEQRGTCLHHYPDLPQALAAPADPSANEWRVHFHVPLFTAEYDGLSSTQEDVRAVLALAVRDGFTRHLEIETYTWDVLPADLKLDMLDSITREFQWVIAEVAAIRRS